MLNEWRLSPHEWLAQGGFAVNQDGERRSGVDILSRRMGSFEKLCEINPALREIDPAVGHRLEIQALYADLSRRQERSIDLYRREENLLIPESIDYSDIANLSNEARDCLQKHRPHTLGAAARLPGVTPAALIMLLQFVHRNHPQPELVPE